MVQVSLIGLVRVWGTRHVWPERFDALVKECEANPEDRLPFGVLADWLDEHGEGEFAEAWRWLARRAYDEDARTGVNVVKKVGPWEAVEWELRNLSDLVASTKSSAGPGDVSTLAGRVAKLALQLAELRSNLA